MAANRTLQWKLVIGHAMDCCAVPDPGCSGGQLPQQSRVRTAVTVPVFVLACSLRARRRVEPAVHVG
jgi:hypothetical protein